MTLTPLTQADLLTHIRSHLIAIGLVRVPRTAGSAPPMWLEPRDGVPAPGEATSGNPTEIGDPVIAAVQSGEVVRGYGERELRTITVDFRIRSSKPTLVWPLDSGLFAAFHERRGYELGDPAGTTTLTVIESRQFRGLQRLGSDSQGFDFVTEYVYEVLSGEGPDG